MEKLNLDTLYDDYAYLENIEIKRSLMWDRRIIKTILLFTFLIL